MGKDMVVEESFFTAICLWETRASNLENFEDEVIPFGKRVFNVKVLETTSIVFTLEPEATEYYVTMFPQMFGFPTEEQMEKINLLEETIDKSQEEINSIFENIKRTGHAEINL